MQLRDLLVIAKRLQSVAQSAAIPEEIVPRLTPGEIGVLDFLYYRKAPSRISDIVSHVQLAQSRVSSIVQSLKKRGWINVRTDPEDGRATKVMLLPKVAQGANAVLSRSALEVLEPLLSSATVENRRAILRGLDLLALALRNPDGKSGN